MINALRCHHCDTPPLQWWDILASDAQSFVDGCPTVPSTSSQRMGAGETISWVGLSYPFLAESAANWLDIIADKWYMQEHYYHYEVGFGVEGQQITAFAQLVYDSTQYVGCAYNRDCDNVPQFRGILPNSVAVCRFWGPVSGYSGERAQHIHNTVARGHCAEPHPDCASVEKWDIPPSDH